MSLNARETAIIVVVSGVTTLNVFLQGALTIAIPTIGRSLNMAQDNLHWPINAYSLALSGLLLFSGRVGDIVGHKRMFLIGTAWFATWSIAVAIAPNDTLLILFTAFEGVGVAANTPAAIGIFSSTFPRGPKRNKAYASLGAGQPLGFIIGLVLGGLLAQSRLMWRSIFYFQAGFSFLLAAIAFYVLEPDVADRRYLKGLDYGGAALSCFAIGLLTYTIAAAPSSSKGWATPHIIALFITSLVCLPLFVCYQQWRDKRGMAVVLPVSMWRKPNARMTAVLSMAVFAWWSFNTLTYFFTLYYQQILRLNPLHTAVRLIPMVLSAVVVNVGVGLLMHRVPGQPLVLLGFAGTAAAAIIFALIQPEGSWWSMAFVMMVLVVGCDVAYPIGTLQIASSFDDDSQSLAGALFNVATGLGSALGVAVSSSIATAVSAQYARNSSLPELSPEALMAGFRAAGWTCCGSAVVALCIALAGLRGLGIVGKSQEPELPKLQDSEVKGTETPVDQKASSLMALT